MLWPGGMPSKSVKIPPQTNSSHEQTQMREYQHLSPKYITSKPNIPSLSFSSPSKQNHPFWGMTRTGTGTGGRDEGGQDGGR